LAGKLIGEAVADKDEDTEKKVVNLEDHKS
jgi:hypothetical protein